MKKTLLKVAVLALTLMQTALASECPSIQLPSSFRAEEEFFSIGTDYTFVSRGSRIASVEERTLNWTTTFELFNASHERVATAQERFLSWGTTIDVFDCNNVKIGTLSEELFTSLFNTYSRFHIYNGQRQEIGLSEREEFFATDFTITPRAGRGLIRMHRPALTFFTHYWDVTLSGNPSQIVDPRLILFIPAFKTSSERHYESSHSNDDSSH